MSATETTLHGAVALSAVALAIAGCGGQGDAAPADGIPQRRPVAYTNEALGFGVDPVSEWTAQEAANWVLFVSPEGTRSFQVVVSEWTGGTLEQLMQREIADFQTAHPDAQLLDDSGSGLVNRQEALRSILRFTDAEGDQSLNLVVVIHEGREYVMSLRTPWIDLLTASYLDTFMGTFLFL